jgi:hypothetical protein
MIKTGIINKNANIKKIKTQEELEEFAEKCNEEIEKSTNELVKHVINKNFKKDEENNGRIY